MDDAAIPGATSSEESYFAARYSQIAMDSVSRTGPSIRVGTVPVGFTDR